MVFKVVFIPNRTKTTLVCILSMKTTIWKKCIPFTPKLIEIENWVFRKINLDFIFRENRTALPHPYWAVWHGPAAGSGVFFCWSGLTAALTLNMTFVLSFCSMCCCVCSAASGQKVQENYIHAWPTGQTHVQFVHTYTQHDGCRRYSNLCRCNDDLINHDILLPQKCSVCPWSFSLSLSLSPSLCSPLT